MALSRHRFAMSCCAEARAQVAAPSADGLPQSLADLVEANGERLSLTLHVPGIHCAGCIGKIEAAVAAQGDGVTGRVNFTRRTITLAWRAQKGSPAAAISALRNLGYTLEPIPREASGADPQGRELMRALAVSGFAAMNVMLLSVSVWAGADGATATFLNWFAALVALPALGYAARPFLRSALTALKNRTLNMDVPISLAIVLAGALSLAHTISGEGETYFDAAITLTFFLLAGRYLDHLARERARTSVRQLATLTPLTAHLFRSGGRTVPVPVDTIVEGDRIHLAAGERLAVDGILEAPATFDLALATGESRPVEAAAGEEVLAGALALTGPVTVQAVRPAADSFIARLAALQHAAESARSRPARIADRAAQLYAPLVHGLAALTFIGWMVTGASAGHALTIAIAVLIITCPCALGLAVPAVHVAACDRLFRRGLVIKDGGVLERLRTLDTAIFDKTGTLTTPELDPSAPVPDAALAEAAALARHSTHPISRAVVRAAEARALSIPAAQDIQEVPGR
ncbi:MAG: heavy metal translocating P-type ATPase, partial [Pseudomonadota bacterium]